MQPYSPHQMNSGAMPPAGEMSSPGGVSAADIAAAQAAVDMSIDPDDRPVVDVTHPTPGLSGS